MFQRGTNDVAGGADNGQRDGAAVFQEAKLIGQPEGTAIYFAVDYDAQPKDYGAIEAYLRAAAKEVPGYLVGVYGSFAIVEEMAKRGACQRFWQTYAWSKGQLSKAANLYQFNNSQTLAGHAVDFNESYSSGGWWGTNPQQVDKPVNNCKAGLRLEEWECKSGLKAIDGLAAKGLLNKPEKWKQWLKDDPKGVLEELPWLVFTPLDRATDKIPHQ
ncbi:glycoside hydrolase domain-containing protein [Brevibacillus sp. SIMBA_040]|uniref:glycoside hydrolase domain-containing protein n=1 Tax=unclassified Brevibacillus TaxID=2684853 RepID=UPI003979B802